MTDVTNRRIRIADYQAHPDNYNEHDEQQIAGPGGLMDSLRIFGQVQTVVVWRAYFVAGHGIAEAARRLGWTELDERVIPDDWSHEKVTAYLLADNEQGRGGWPNLEQLAQLAGSLGDGLASVAAGGEAALADLMELYGKTDARDAPDASEPTGVSEPAQLTRRDVPDAIFATDNEFGIPLLDAGMQATALIAPVQPWGMGAKARSRQNRGTWHFYTEDYRFDALWTDPSPVVASGCQVAVEPNYSAYLEMPRAVALWSIYRKRWLARWWQLQGIRVFVDLNVAEPHYEDNLLGVPAGWTAWATRGYVDRLHLTDVEFEMACERASTKSITFLVYGGGKAVRERCLERGWIHIIEQRDAAKEVRDGKR